MLQGVPSVIRVVAAVRALGLLLCCATVLAVVISANQGPVTPAMSEPTSAPASDTTAGCVPLGGGSVALVTYSSGDVGFADTYTYVNGNPINAWDPSGHRPEGMTPKQYQQQLAGQKIDWNQTGGHEESTWRANERAKAAQAERACTEPSSCAPTEAEIAAAVDAFIIQVHGDGESGQYMIDQHYQMMARDDGGKSLAAFRDGIVLAEKVQGTCGTSDSWICLVGDPTVQEWVVTLASAGEAGVAIALARRASLRAAAAGTSKFGTLTHASAGIAPYSTQRALTAGKGGSIQAHHLIEKRFADVIGGNTDDWATIVVTQSEHQAFTKAWREAIPYGPAGTGMATRAQVEGAARNVYRDYPEILQVLGLG